MKQINLSTESSVMGEYLVSVIKKDGTTYFPFGKKNRKNLILDSFYSAILSGYRFGLQSFIQTCRVGVNSTPPSRTQTGLVGSIVGQTSASGNFITSVDSASNSISLSREFIFPETPAGVQISYAEAVVGNFSISNTDPITTSRFVFPGVLILDGGDILKITYTLKLIINYLNSNSNITLTGGGLNFGGYIRMSTNDIGLIAPVVGNNTIITLGNTNVHVFRDFTQNSTSTTTDNDPSTYGAFQNIFGTALWANQIGFFDGSHTPVNYPNKRITYIPVGPLGTLSISNLQQTATSSSIDATYYFSGHTSSRVVGGLYLWYHDNTNSNSAIYYKFNSNQTIPANTPVTLKIKWIFNRI